MRKLWLILPILVAALLGARQTASAQPRLSRLEQLEPEEHELLKQGRIVLHQRSQVIGSSRLYGGTSWQRIKARPEVVWQALMDTSHYPMLVPQVAEARLVDSTPDQRLVYLRHGDGLVRVQYHLVMNYVENAHAVWFHVDPSRPGSLRRGRGFIVIRPWGESQSVMTFNAYADIGGGMITSLLRPRIQEGVLRIPWSMKRYIEGQGRSRYQRTLQARREM